MAWRQTQLESDTSSWLVEELREALAPAPEAEPETAEDWTPPGPVPRDERGEGAPDARDDHSADDSDQTANGAEPDRATAEKAGVKEEELAALGAEAREMRAEVDGLRAEVGGLVAGLEVFTERLERVESEVASREASAESNNALLSALDRNEAAEETEPPSGRLSLSAVTFEDLRRLGCSTTQAARVLSYRDTHGFDSIDRIRDVRGMPNELVQRLKTRLTV